MQTIGSDEKYRGPLLKGAQILKHTDQIQGSGSIRLVSHRAAELLIITIQNTSTYGCNDQDRIFFENPRLSAFSKLGENETLSNEKYEENLIFIKAKREVYRKKEDIKKFFEYCNLMRSFKNNNRMKFCNPYEEKKFMNKILMKFSMTFENLNRVKRSLLIEKGIYVNQTSKSKNRKIPENKLDEIKQDEINGWTDAFWIVSA